MDKDKEFLDAFEKFKDEIGKGDIVVEQTPKMIGWICPVCGRGLSPFTTVCPCKNKWEITC